MIIWPVMEVGDDRSLPTLGSVPKEEHTYSVLASPFKRGGPPSLNLLKGTLSR